MRTPHVPVARPAGGGAPRKTGPSRRRSFSSRKSVDRVNLFLALAFVFRTTDWRTLIRSASEEADEQQRRAQPG